MMFRNLVALAMLLTPLTLGAETAQPADTIEAYRLAIYAGDVATVEATAAEEFRRFKTGDASADDLRNSMSVFSSTHPEVSAFAKGWAEAAPTSPYARMAWAWTLYTRGGLVRGTRSARQTYAKAMRQHLDDHQRAFELAKQVLDDHPDYIPASDLILLVARNIGKQDWAFHIMDKTMIEQPNWGTVKRALSMTHKGYGGSSDMAEAICRFYAPRLNDPAPDMVNYCLTHAHWIGFFDAEGKDRAEALARLIEGQDHEIYHFYHALNGTLPTSTHKQAAFAKWYFDTYTVTNIHLAGRFDRYVAMRFNYPFVKDQTIRNAHAAARAELVHDPFNPDLLDFLEVGQTETVRTDRGTVTSRVTSQLSDEERLQFLSRRLTVSPYDPDHWESYATEIRTAAMAAGGYDIGFPAVEAPMVNAIVYSEHNPEVLRTYVARKMQQIEYFRMAAETRLGGVWPALLAETDQQAQLFCPAIRAFLLLGDDKIGLPALMQQELANMTEAARADGRCTKVLNASAGELAFKPIDVDLPVPPF